MWTPLSMSRSPQANDRMKRGPPSQRPTIRDVSRLAGVSRMTVSRVISDPDLVLPLTRETVMRETPARRDTSRMVGR